VTITGFGNLALKVSDIDAAEAFYRSTGAAIGARAPWCGGERLDVELAGVPITLFTRAVYDDDLDVPAECFLHMAVFTDDLDATLAGRDVVWGPEVVEGGFGRRRIAFVDAPGATRLEFMQQLDGPAPGDGAGPPEAARP
jgi:catechol 2,3-dioxygenase-like lactoylglutathione lyase family enzyme